MLAFSSFTRCRCSRQPPRLDDYIFPKFSTLASPVQHILFFADRAFTIGDKAGRAGAHYIYTPNTADATPSFLRWPIHELSPAYRHPPSHFDFDAMTKLPRLMRKLDGIACYLLLALIDVSLAATSASLRKGNLLLASKASSIEADAMARPICSKIVISRLYRDDFNRQTFFRDMPYT